MEARTRAPASMTQFRPITVGPSITAPGSMRVPDPMAKIKELLDLRAPYYRMADITIDTSEKSVDRIISEIKERIKHAYC